MDDEIKTVVSLDANTIAAFRLIRLFLWKERENWRRVAANTKDPKFGELAASYAEWHIAAVKTLDTLFDPEDTVEADQAKEQPK